MSQKCRPKLLRCTLYLQNQMPEIVKVCNNTAMGYLFRKKTIRGVGGGVEGMEFPGVLKKEHVEIPEVD